MNFQKVIIAIVTSSSILVSCGKTDDSAATMLAKPKASLAWTPADAKDVEERFGSLLGKDGIIAACFVKVAENFAVPALTVRALWEGTRDGPRLIVTGPSMHHVPHVQGTVFRIDGAPHGQEGLQVYKIDKGTLVQVSGEDTTKPVSVSEIRLNAVLDDMARKEFRETVELKTNKGIMKFANCRLGALPEGPDED